MPTLPAMSGTLPRWLARFGEGHLPEVALTGPGLFEPNEMLVFGEIGREILHEEEAIFCGADCGCVEAGGTGSACGGSTSEGRDQRADLLSMEEAVCWFGDRPGPADEATSGRERPVETTGCRS